MVAGGGFGGSTEVARFHALLGLDASGFTSGMAAARTQAVGFRGALVGAGGLVAGLLGMQLGMSAVSRIIGGSISNVIDYETAFVGLQKTVELTNEQFDILDENIRGLALRIPVGRVELARIGQIAGQLGIEGVDDLTKYIETIAMIGPTTDLSTEEAAVGFARLFKILDEPIENVNVLAAQIVSLGNNFAAFEPEILALGLRIAVVGRIVGLTSGEVLALSAAVAQTGVPAEAGGSALQRTFLTINEAVIGAGKELELFALVSGQSADEFAKQWETDAAGAFQSFIAGLARAGDQAKPILDVVELGGLRVARTLLALAGDPGEITRALEDQAAQAAAPLAAIEEFAKFAATTASQLDIFRSSVVELGDEIGGPLVAALNDILPPLTAFVQLLTADISKGGKSLLGNLVKVTPGLEPFGILAAIPGGIRAAGVAIGAVGAGVDFGKDRLGGIFGSGGEAGTLPSTRSLQQAVRDPNFVNEADRIRAAFEEFPELLVPGVIRLTEATDEATSAQQDWIDQILALINATNGATGAEDRLAIARLVAIENVEDVMTRRLVEAFIRGGDDAVAAQRSTNDRMLAEFERLRPGIQAIGGDIAELWFDIFQTVFEGTEAISGQFDNLLGLLIARRLDIAEQTGGDPGFTVRRRGGPLESSSMQFTVEGNIVIGEGARTTTGEVADGLVVGGRQLLAEQAQEA